MNSRTKKIGAVTALIVLLTASVCLALFRSSGIKPTSLPDPNGYDDFVRAGHLLLVDSSGYADASPADLQLMVASNAPALSVLRRGLEKESRVPLHYMVEDSDNWANDLPQMKGLATALCAEARYELLQGNPDRAAEICLETIQMGVESCRGGLFIHRLVGIALESVGFRMLNEVLPELDASVYKRTTQELDGILAAREPLTVVAESERFWSRRTSGFRDVIAAVVMTRSLKPFQSLAGPILAKCEQNENGFDRNLLDIASSAYELEQGHPPESVNELVPEFLKAIPIDPVNGEPMELR